MVRKKQSLITAGIFAFLGMMPAWATPSAEELSSEENLPVSANENAQNAANTAATSANATGIATANKVIQAPALQGHQPKPEAKVSTRIVETQEEIKPFRFLSDWEIGIERQELALLGNASFPSLRWRYNEVNKLGLMLNLAESLLGYRFFYAGFSHYAYLFKLRYVAINFFSDMAFMVHGQVPEGVASYLKISNAWINSFAASAGLKVEFNVPYVERLNVGLGFGLNLLANENGTRLSFAARELLGRASLYYYF